MKNLILALLLIPCAVACGTGPANRPPAPTPVATPGLTGEWEIVFTSTEGNPGGLLEVDLGTGISPPEPPMAGQKYSGIYVASYLISDNTLTSTVGGACGVAEISTASASGNDVQFTLSSGKATGSGTGTYNNAVITGTYTIPAPCTDKGTFVATSVNTAMVGSKYSGNVLFTDGTHVSMSVDFGTITSPGNPFSFVAAVQISGTDNYSSNNPGGQAGGHAFGASFTLGETLIADNNPNSIVNVCYVGFQVTQNDAAFFPTAVVGDLVLWELPPTCADQATISSTSPFVGILTLQ